MQRPQLLQAMSLDEPLANGDTPEDLLRAAQRRKRLKYVAAVVVVVIAVAIGVSLLPTTPSKSVYVDPVNSACHPGNTFSCTIVLDPKQGTAPLAVSEVKSVMINGTHASTTQVTATGNDVSIVATVPGVPFSRGLPDVGNSQRPASVGDVEVFLSDGTTVSVVLGIGGILP